MNLSRQPTFYQLISLLFDNGQNILQRSLCVSETVVETNYNEGLLLVIKCVCLCVCPGGTYWKHLVH